MMRIFEQEERKRIDDEAGEAGAGESALGAAGGESTASSSGGAGDASVAAPGGAWAYPAELWGPGAGSSGIVLEEDPIHPLAEAPRERRGPFGISIVAHIAVIALVIARATWLAEHP